MSPSSRMSLHVLRPATRALSTSARSPHAHSHTHRVGGCGSSCTSCGSCAGARASAGLSRLNASVDDTLTPRARRHAHVLPGLVLPPPPPAQGPDPRLSRSHLSAVEYHQCADQTLAAITTQLEDLLEAVDDATITADRMQARAEADWDVVGTSGMVTLGLGSHGEYLLKKQDALRQLWLSSPVSGAHMFVFEPAAAALNTPTGVSRKSVAGTGTGTGPTVVPLRPSTSTHTLVTLAAAGVSMRSMSAQPMPVQRRMAMFASGPASGLASQSSASLYQPQLQPQSAAAGAVDAWPGAWVSVRPLQENGPRELFALLRAELPHLLGLRSGHPSIRNLGLGATRAAVV